MSDTPPRPMRVLNRSVYRGPHLYSLTPMVRFALDLGALADRPSNTLPGFTDALLAAVPTLQEHGCSYGEPGGFVRRLRDGTWLGHVTEHVAIELQSLAGARVTRGKTRAVRGQEGVYNVMYAYEDERVGLLAGRFALALVDSLLPPDLRGVQDLDVLYRDDEEEPALGAAPFALAPALAALTALARRTSLGPTTAALVREARRRGIPVMRLDELSLVQLGHGRRQQQLRASVTGQTSHVAVESAGNKALTKALLSGIGVPVPRGEVVRSAEEAEQEAERLGYPVVTKPLNGNHGRGVRTGLRTPEEVRAAFDVAAQHARSVIVEQHFEGDDHRILVVGGEVVAVARRLPAQVVGDGVRSVSALVDAVNQDPRRGVGHKTVLTRIALDAGARARLAELGLTPESVPDAGQVVVLQATANLSTGGTAIDCTDIIHPENAAIARRAALAVGLDVAGIDFLAPDIARSVRETGGGIVEVNAAPGFRMHLQPSEGTPRDVARPVLRLLYPRGASARIPILAVTGTNGKSTTARMVAHVFARSGLTVGLTTTSGVYVDGLLVNPGDATGPKSARMVLRDPTVEVAVLETARGGLLREGLGFDRCDVGAVLNVAEDHLGLGGIETVEDLAWLKSLVVRVGRRDGCSVLNADDPLTLRMRRRAPGRVALFSRRGVTGNAILARHIEAGHLAVVCEAGAAGDELVVYEHGERGVLMRAADVPATLGGLAPFNVENALAAAAICLGQGADWDTVRAGLSSFTSSFEQSPGRLNVFDGHPFRVILDYAHNAAGLEAQRALLVNLRPSAGRMLGMVSVPGDRRDDDIRRVGEVAAAAFDELFFREGPDGRGRPRGEVTRLLAEGARAVGFPEEHIHTVLEERDAVNATLRAARPGDLVVIMPTRVEAVWRQIQAFVPDA